MNTSKKYILIVFGIIAIIVSYIHLSDSYLWFDESGQFFISQGLNHTTEPLSRSQGFCMALENNRHSNLDPGGFTAILYFWELISQNAHFLRLLPYIFFVFYLVYIYKIGKRVIGDSYYAVLFTIIAMLFPVISRQAAELRAYSMEMLGTASSVLFIIKYKSKLDYKHLFYLSLILSFFCTSRYSFIIVAFAISLRIIWLKIKEGGFSWKTITYLAVYFAPLLAIIATIYFGMTRYQAPQTLSNVVDYACYLSNNLKCLIYPLPILFYLNIAILLYYKYKKHNVPELLVLCVFVGTSYFVFSLLSVFPFDYYRSMSLTIMLIITPLALFLNEVCDMDKKGIMGFSSGLLVIILFGISLLLNHPYRKNPDKEMINSFASFAEQNRGKVMYIPDVHVMPNVKYLYEYGIWKERAEKDGYPEQFYFCTKGKPVDEYIEFNY